MHKNCDKPNARNNTPICFSEKFFELMRKTACIFNMGNPSFISPMKKAALGSNGRASSAFLLCSIKLPAMLPTPGKLSDFDNAGMGIFSPVLIS
mmetsp:Transcript_13511/g.27182  ORF Transcript_13511/g.27182 Transcript_13511/m.27182 type:complete len:94 (-) Transcript_13511:197-478(-)